jgi:hypothetical protein
MGRVLAAIKTPPVGRKPKWNLHATTLSVQV